MVNFLKQSFLLLFIGLLLINTGGSLIFFKLREAAIEASFKNALRNNKLLGNVAVVEFTEADLIGAEWEDGHEVKLNGHYYDVIATHYKNGHTVYTCFADDDETALYCWYKEYQEQEAEDGEEDDLSEDGNTYLYKPQKLSYISGLLQTINTLYAGLNAQSTGIAKFPPPKS